MAQVVRWYVMPLEVRVDGRLAIPQSLRTLLQGRWTYYRLPGDRWAVVRIRGEDAQHAILESQVGMFTWPRGRSAKWDARAPVALRNRLSLLGFDVTGNPWPDEVLDALGQFHQDYVGNYGTPWNRLRERRSDEAALGAVEEV